MMKNEGGGDGYRDRLHGRLFKSTSQPALFTCAPASPTALDVGSFVDAQSTSVGTGWMNEKSRGWHRSRSRRSVLGRGLLYVKTPSILGG